MGFFMLAVHERQTVSRPSSRGPIRHPPTSYGEGRRSMETSLYDEYKEKYNKEGILELHKGKLMKNLEKKFGVGDPSLLAKVSFPKISH